MTAARTAALALLAPIGRASGPPVVASPEDTRLAHEVGVLAELKQRLAQADAQGDARGGARLAVLVAARRDRLAASQRAVMPEGEPEEVRRALELLLSDEACGRL